MKLVHKLRWRIEKNTIDPLVNLYLRKRFYQKEITKHDEKVFVAGEKKLEAFPTGNVFQSMVSGSSLENVYSDDFEKAYLRGFKNEPFYEKEPLRYRVFINAIIASQANKLVGSFCTVGVSWGIVPRTVFEFLNLRGSSKSYYLVDKWDKSLASDGGTSQGNYCGDFEFIENEFSESNFKIIREFAPKGCEKISDQISYLHLNTGDRISEVETLKLLWKKITTPGFIVIDNYSFSNDSERSFDLFLKEKNNSILPLGNGQGIIFKV